MCVLYCFPVSPWELQSPSVEASLPSWLYWLSSLLSLPSHSPTRGGASCISQRNFLHWNGCHGVRCWGTQMKTMVFAHSKVGTSILWSSFKNCWLCFVFGEGWEEGRVERQGWGCMSFHWHLISLAPCGLLTHQRWEGESLSCLLVIASFRKISSALNRVLCDQPIHQFLQSWCWWPCSGAPPRKSPDEKSHLSFHFSCIPAPFVLVLVHFIFLTRAVLNTYQHMVPANGRAFRWDVSGDAALLSVMCHPELHSLGSNPVAWDIIRQQCQSIMNVSGWWIYYNNITIGSTRNALYLNLSFSMAMHCVESSYFFSFGFEWCL